MNRTVPAALVTCFLTACNPTGFTSASGREFEVVSALARVEPGRVELLLSSDSESCGTTSPFPRERLVLVLNGDEATDLAFDPAAAAAGRNTDWARGLRIENDGRLWSAIRGEADYVMDPGGRVRATFEGYFARETSTGTQPVATFEMSGSFEAQLCSQLPSVAGAEPRGSLSCQTRISTSLSCTDYEWRGSLDRSTLSAACQANGGSVVSSCSRTGSFGGCRTTTTASGTTTTVTSWFYEESFRYLSSTERQNALRSACTSGTVVSP
jgi:hypothetical protein